MGRFDLQHSGAKQIPFFRRRPSGVEAGHDARESINDIAGGGVLCSPQ